VTNISHFHVLGILENLIEDFTVVLGSTTHLCNNNSKRGKFERSQYYVVDHVYMHHIKECSYNAVDPIMLDSKDVSLLWLNTTTTEYQRD
jgi:hypothetical protein